MIGRELKFVPVGVKPSNTSMGRPPAFVGVFTMIGGTS